MTLKNATGWFLMGVLVACGSRKDQDAQKLKDEEAAAKKAEKAEASAGVLISSNKSSNAEVEKLPPCFFALGQTTQFKNTDIEAQFKGTVDLGCKTGGKEPILLIQSGGIQLSLPVELDCQPKKRDQFNIICGSVASIVDGTGKVDLRIKADSNYKSSQVKIRFGYE
jgi:hypothetical protein